MKRILGKCANTSRKAHNQSLERTQKAASLSLIIMRGNMETAPKSRLILLLIPEFGIHQESWWLGHWSFVHQKWVLRTPYAIEQKVVICTDIPQPISWAELPQAHNQTLQPTTKSSGDTKAVHGG